MHKRTHQQIQYVINLVHNWNRWLKSECIDAIYVCGAPFSSGTVYNLYTGYIAIWYMRTIFLLANAILNGAKPFVIVGSFYSCVRIWANWKHIVRNRKSIDHNLQIVEINFSSSKCISNFVSILIDICV